MVNKTYIHKRENNSCHTKDMNDSVDYEQFPKYTRKDETCVATLVIV